MNGLVVSCFKYMGEMIAVSKVKRSLFVLAVSAAVFVFCCIFVLTEQASVETTDLSTSVYEQLVGTEMDAAGFESASSDDDPLTGTVPPTSSVFAWLLSVAGIRKWAHTAEFFALGVPVAIAVLFWWGRPGSAAARSLMAFAACACASLFDQTHKLFVPGREFDVSDLAFDLLGYGCAIILVFGVVGVVSYCVGRWGARGA